MYGIVGLSIGHATGDMAPSGAGLATEVVNGAHTLTLDAMFNVEVNLQPLTELTVPNVPFPIMASSME